MTRVVEYHDTLATTPLGTNGPTFELWRHCPVVAATFNPFTALGAGRFFQDDFVCVGEALGFVADGAAAHNQLSCGPYKVFATATVGFEGSATEDALITTAMDADNNEAYLGTGSGAFVISDTAGEDRELIFECQFKKSSITDDELDMFIGLASPAAIAAGGLVDGTGIPLVNGGSFCGFNTVTAAGEILQAGHKAAGDAAITAVIASSATLVADTYVKAGFRYNPRAIGAERIEWWINGTKQTTFTTSTQIAAATFPDQEEMCMAVLWKIGDTVTEVGTLNWWRIWQEPIVNVPV